MPFIKDDPRINRSGRIPKKDSISEEEPRTNRQKKDKEFHALLRKLKPHMSSAIVVAAKILNKEDATDLTRLKAATLLLDVYRKTVIDSYEDEEITSNDNPNQEVEEDKVPVLSLRVVNQDD